MSTAHQEHQRTYYDRTYPRRVEAVREQLVHPLFRSFQDRLARRVLDAARPPAATASTPAPTPASTSAGSPASNPAGSGAGVNGHGANGHGANGQGPATLRVFETACGEGLLGAALLREAAERGIDVHYSGTDLSSSALDLARPSVGDDLVVGDAVEVTAGMASGSADVVIIKNLLHHLEDPAGLLREAGRVVGPTGHVVIVEARLGAPPVTMLAMMAPKREKFFWVGARRNRKAVADAGLTIQHAERFSFLPYELFFQIRFGTMRRLFSTSNPRTIERISRLDDRLAKVVPALSSYWVWVAAPTAPAP